MSDFSARWFYYIVTTLAFVALGFLAGMHTRPWWAGPIILAVAWLMWLAPFVLLRWEAKR